MLEDVRALFQALFFHWVLSCQAISLILITWITSADVRPLFWALELYLIAYVISSLGYKDLKRNMYKPEFIIFSFPCGFLQCHLSVNGMTIHPVAEKAMRKAFLNLPFSSPYILNSLTSNIDFYVLNVD